MIIISQQLGWNFNLMIWTYKHKKNLKIEIQLIEKV